MAAQEREQRQGAPPALSVSELLPSCAAAHTISTPPTEPPRAFEEADEEADGARSASATPVQDLPGHRGEPGHHGQECPGQDAA